MTVGRERKVETRFARRTATGKGVGIEEAVAAAEARIQDMQEGAREGIGAMLAQMHARRAALAAGDPAAFAFVRAQADALVGLAAPFGLPEAGQAAFSLCQLYDASAPHAPTAESVRVHLDALQVLSSAEPEVRAMTAPPLLEGLARVTEAARRQADPG